MKIMDRKVFREIKIQKFRSLLIVSIVTVTVAMILGMRAGYPMIMATYEENMRHNNVADGRFTLTAPISDSNITQIRNDAEFLRSNNIADIEGRLIIYSEMQYAEETFPCIVIGVNFPNLINKVYLEENSTFAAENSNFLQNKSNCIIESQFAGNLLGQDVQIGEKISVLLGTDDHQITVEAIGQDTDFIYVVDPVSQMTLMGQLAVVWMDLSELQDQLFGGAPLINQILFTVEERLDKPLIHTARDALLHKFATNQIDISTLQFEIYDETLDRQFFDADAGSMDKMGTLFGVIGLIMCCVAIYNTISRLVQSQRKNIGLFMSLGSNSNKIVFHYVKITVYLTLIGLLIGVPLGHLFAIGMTQLLVRLFPFQVFLYPIVIQEYLLGSLVTLGVCTIFSGLSAFPITKITPREAMSAIFHRIKAVKSSFSEKIFSWIPGFRSLHMLVPIREIFLRKRKSLITILAITTSLIMLITSIAMVGNMFTALNQNFTEYNTSQYRVQLENSIPMSEIATFMDNLPSDTIDHYESTIKVYSNMVFGGKIQGGFLIECFQANSTFRSLNIIEGEISDKTALNSTSIILGNAIAAKYDIQIGDEIQIGLLENYTVEIAGIVGEFLDHAGFWTIEAFTANNNSLNFGMPANYVNGFMFNLGSEADIVEIRAQFDSQFAIAQWIDADQSHQSMMTLIKSMTSLLVLFILVGVLIGILFSFNTMYMGFISRENDFLAFKAMGTDPRYFTKMIFWENAILSLFSLVVTVPIGYLVYWLSMDYLFADNFYMPLSIPWYTWPCVFGLSLISIWLATRKLTKRIRKLNLADELRSRMLS